MNTANNEPILLLFDIDNTLIEASKAPPQGVVDCAHRAVQRVFEQRGITGVNAKPIFRNARGQTHKEVFTQVVRRALGEGASSAETHAILDQIKEAYCNELITLPHNSHTLCPNAHTLLNSLGGKKNVICGLLVDDWAAIACARLANTGTLDHFVYRYGMDIDLSSQNAQSLNKLRVSEVRFLNNGGDVPKISVNYFISTRSGNNGVTAATTLSQSGLLLGAFAEDGETCRDLVPLSIKRIQATTGIDVPMHRIFVVGDRPTDIKCARAAGVHSIAVATGRFPSKRLQNDYPTILLPHLPLSADELIKRLHPHLAGSEAREARAPGARHHRQAPVLGANALPGKKTQSI